MRRVFLEWEGSLSRCISEVAQVSIQRPTHVVSSMRFMQYEIAGGTMPKHTDLRKTDILVPDRKSTHTFILHLRSCVDGSGATSFYTSENENPVFSAVPTQGRLLLFPHAVLHSGDPVSEPRQKLFLRGELCVG